MFSRQIGLLGDISPLKNAQVIVFGIGGVGGHACEALVRSGIGSVTFVDGDMVSTSNINRQLVATSSTVGRNKATLMKLRAEDINPEGNFSAVEKYLTEENIEDFSLSDYDYIVDCIDDVRAKIVLAKYAEDNGKKIVSCMSTGNKLNPMGFVVSDIYSTDTCPLCRVIRSELRKKGVKHLKVIFSREEPLSRPPTPNSVSFVPSSAGLLVASVVIKELALSE